MDAFHTCLWFDHQAEEAARFYVSLFPNSSMGEVTHYEGASAEAANRPVGSVLTISFTLNGHKFVGLNGGPAFKFSEAVSFMVPCATQEELDRYWDALLDGGEAQACGWLKDRFGVSWQIVPASWERMLTDPDPVKRARYMTAMMEMTKLDIALLEQAFEG